MFVIPDFNRLKIIVLVIIVNSIALAGCAAFKPYTVKKQVSDPEFTMLEILATGLVLGGITSSVEPFDDQQREEMTALLETILLQHSIYKINTAVKLSDRLKKSQYQKILNEFRTSSSLAVDVATALKEKLYPARYILFINVIRDDVTKKTSRIPNAINYTTTRSTEVTLNIFSLKTQKPAVLANITATNKKTNKIEEHRNRDPLISTMRIVVNQLVMGGYPEPPGIKENLRKVFLGVADQIPRK